MRLHTRSTLRIKAWVRVQVVSQHIKSLMSQNAGESRARFNNTYSEGAFLLCTFFRLVCCLRSLETGTPGECFSWYRAGFWTRPGLVRWIILILPHVGSHLSQTAMRFNSSILEELWMDLWVSSSQKVHLLQWFFRSLTSVLLIN
jgi:hypothetical protein